MEYSDYHNNPELQQEFNHVFTDAKERFKTECEKHGMDKEQAEVISIKAANVETDYYFSSKTKKSKD